MAWITDLSNLFSHSNVSEIQMDKLYGRFQDKPESVMAAAIDLYIEDGQYFPSIAAFKPYVETAEHMEMAKAPRSFGIVEGPDGDDERFRIEVERGTMRPIEEIEAEIQEVAQVLVVMRQRERVTA